MSGLVGPFTESSNSKVGTHPTAGKSLWGVEEHVEAVFAAVGASATIERETVDFDFPSIDDAVGSLGGS
jgi:hypothetical protein